MSFQQGLSGLFAAGRNLEVIGINVANASTVGFKGSRAEFAVVYANSVGSAGNVNIGIGTRLAAVAQQFNQGNIPSTGNPLDVAISGEGFFRVSAAGSIAYTRNGQFQLDKDGYIVTNTGAEIGDLIRKERVRRVKRHKAAKAPDRFAEALRRGVETFLVRQGSKQTVIAGYPWFADWGRDAFISLPGLFLVTGQYEAGWDIIQSFIPFVSEGMVPNRFPDLGKDPDYNAIDASLWFIHAVDSYLAYSKDTKRVRLVAWPAIRQILDGYRQGTRYNIEMDIDGLISGGMPGVQLTWMDAKIGDWVVTPRHGKPVRFKLVYSSSGSCLSADKLRVIGGDSQTKLLAEGFYGPGNRFRRVCNPYGILPASRRAHI